MVITQYDIIMYLKCWYDGHLYDHALYRNILYLLIWLSVIINIMQYVNKIL